MYVVECLNNMRIQPSHVSICMCILCVVREENRIVCFNNSMGYLIHKINIYNIHYNE